MDLKFQLGQQILEFKHSEVCFTTFPGNINQVILICKWQKCVVQIRWQFLLKLTVFILQVIAFIIQ